MYAGFGNQKILVPGWGLHNIITSLPSGKWLHIWAGFLTFIMELILLTLPTLMELLLELLEIMYVDGD